MENGRKTMLVNSQIMIGDMFQSLGVQVHFSTIDCDDTIAAFAFHKKGSVLSQDADFFRYYVESSRETEPPYTVYSDFEMIGGRLSLTSNQSSRPQTRETESFAQENPGQFARDESKCIFYLRYPGLFEGPTRGSEEEVCPWLWQLSDPGAQPPPPGQTSQTGRLL